MSMTDEALRGWLLLWVKDYCNTDWEQEPPGVLLFLNQAISWIKTQNGITSESLGDYSVSFAEGLPEGFKELLEPYRVEKEGKQRRMVFI